VLRALKDLEYERSVGKISEEDYHEYSARYRAEAKRLIQSLDENLAEGRRQVEAELSRRLSKKSTKAKPSEAVEAETNGESAPENADRAAPDESPAMTRDCPACQVKNEFDARFCKGCGKSMAEAEESSS
jgi:hypothetical protein